MCRSISRSSDSTLGRSVLAGEIEERSGNRGGTVTEWPRDGMSADGVATVPAITVFKQAPLSLGRQEKHLEPFLAQEQLRQIALVPLQAHHL